MRRTAALVLILAGALFVGALPPAADGAAPSRRPLAGVIIAIDPGHNGGNSSHSKQVNRKVWIGNAWKVCNTSGTSTNAGYPEHRFTWAMARLLRSRLQALGATVKLQPRSNTGWGRCS